MIALIIAAAAVIRANADLLARNGYAAAEVIASIIRMANRLNAAGEYNAHGTAIREFAAAVKRKADYIDANENGIRCYVDPTDGSFTVVAEVRPTVNRDAAALDALFHELYSLGLSA